MMLLALATGWLLGVLIVAQLWPREWPLRRDLTILLPLGFFVGLGVTSVVFFAASLWLPRPLYAAGLECVGLLMLLASVFRRWVREAPRVASSSPSTWSERLLGFVFVQLSIIAMIVAWRTYGGEPFGGWDAWAIWNMHARFMLRAGPQWPDLLTAAQLSWTHPDYPRLLPASVARLWAWGGEEQPLASALLSFGFAASTVALLIGIVARLRGRGVGLLGGIVLLATPFFVTFAANEHADIPVGGYMFAAIALLALANHSPGTERIWLLAGGCAGFAAWTKNEGQLFVGVMAVVLANHCRRPNLWRFGGFFAMGLAVGLIAVVYFKLRWAPPNDLVVAGKSAAVENILNGSRHATIFAALWRDLISFGEWRVAPWIALALPLLAWRSVRRLEGTERLIPVVTGTMLLGFYVVYLLSSQDLAGHLDSSLVRLLLQLWPMTLMMWTLVVPNLESGTRSSLATQSPWRARWVSGGVFVGLNCAAAVAIAAVLSGQRGKDELAVRRFGLSTISVALGDGWFPLERHDTDEWSWSSGQAKLRFYSGGSAASHSVTLRFALTSVGARTIVIRDGTRELWRGEVNDARVPIELRGVAIAPGTATFDFTTDTPGAKESASAGGRTLAFAIFNLRME